MNEINKNKRPPLGSLKKLKSGNATNFSNNDQRALANMDTPDRPILSSKSNPSVIQNDMNLVRVGAFRKEKENLQNLQNSFR